MKDVFTKKNPKVQTSLPPKRENTNNKSLSSVLEGAYAPRQKKAEAATKDDPRVTPCQQKAIPEAILGLCTPRHLLLRLLRLQARTNEGQRSIPTPRTPDVTKEDVVGPSGMTKEL